jgi:ABC-type thiamin/hydroxymethylpyrimidine transport system permease subunit
LVRSSKARQAVLGVTALVFTGVALGSALVPHTMAAGLGYTLDNVDALNEFRAIYVGLWLATAALLIIALRRIDEPLLGDVAAMLVLGQTGGRLLSLLLDGTPSMRIWPVFILEAIGGLVLLIVRPSGRSAR